MKNLTSTYLTIYKVFLRSLESLQYKAALTITGAIKGTFRNKIYQELGLESFKPRRWYKRLTCMFKIMKKEAPNYLINLIPKCEAAIRTRKNNFPSYNCRTDCFKYSFFPSTLNDWFRLDINIRNSESILLFKSRLLSFIRPNQSNIYNIFDPIGLKLLPHLRLGLSHLNEPKFSRMSKSFIFLQFGN